MKQILILIITFLITATYCAAQNKTEPDLSQMTEKELAEYMKKAMEERNKILSKPQILYYSPVVNPSGSHIAYIKRTLEYNLKGGGFIPFLGDSPEVTWKSEVVEFYKREVATGAETVLERWQMPKPDNGSDVSYIWVDLEWNKSGLFYEINFSSYKRSVIKGGHPCRGSGFCIKNKDGDIVQGPSAANGVKVSLDEDPARSRFPTSNKIILECNDARKTCLSF